MASAMADDAPGPPSGKLTPVELSILRELIQDPHASNRKISESLGLSISQIGTRIQRLEQQHYAHVLAVLDIATAGQSLAFIFITVRGRPISEVAKDLSAFREVQTVVSVILGDFDLAAILRFRTTAHLEELLHGRISKISGCYGLMCQVVLGTYRFTEQYIAFSLAGLPGETGELLSELLLELDDGLVDSLDRNIIAELQADGRMTSQHIARQYDVNAGTIRNRIRSLEARGLMRFVTVIDPRAMGLNAYCIVLIDVQGSELMGAVERLQRIESMHYLFSCAGSFAVIGFLIVEDLDRARDIISNQIRTIPGVRAVNMSPLIENHKVDVRWASHVMPLGPPSV